MISEKQEDFYQDKLDHFRARVSWLKQLRKRQEFGARKGDLVRITHKHDTKGIWYQVDNFLEYFPRGRKIKKDGTPAKNLSSIYGEVAEIKKPSP